MSKLQWMFGVLPLLLAAAPPGLADEAGDAQREAVVLAAPIADEAQSQDDSAQRVHQLEAEVKELKAELAARSSEAPRYLDQNDPLTP